jgi:hypothetical protein
MFNAPFGKSQYAEKSQFGSQLAHAGDSRDTSYGNLVSYNILTAGGHSGTTAVDVPCYAASTISFAASTKRISDSANLMAFFKTGDTIKVTGSVSNDGVYTVATGNTAGYCVVNEALIDESAGNKVIISKRASPSNNCVVDNTTGLMWMRYTTLTGPLKIGRDSDGKLNWYDAAYRRLIHGAAADLQGIYPNTLRIVGGAGEASRYFLGMVIELTGFASFRTTTPGFRIIGITVNGADLDITVDIGYTWSIWIDNEAAGGSRSIYLLCNSIFAYAAACNAARLAGYDDWRVPNMREYYSILDWGGVNCAPNGVAFPGWPSGTSVYLWASSTYPVNSVQASILYSYSGSGSNFSKTGIASSTQYVYGELVRGK